MAVVLFVPADCFMYLVVLSINMRLALMKIKYHLNFTEKKDDKGT